MSIGMIIVTVIVLLVLLYLIINYFSKSSTGLTTLQNGNEQQTIDASTLPNNNNTSNYTYSTWFYVQDWNYRFGEPKVLLQRLDEEAHPSPKIVLGAIENNIEISIACYPDTSSQSSSQTTIPKAIIHKCAISNFPLQAWVNLIISLYGRTLDVYVDGKLVRTCVLPGVAMVGTKTNIQVTPNGGFNGWTSNFEYWDDATNPQQAYNIYKSGYGGSAVGSIFNKYRLKFSFMEDNQEQASFEI
jgi:hypothetical protein